MSVFTRMFRAPDPPFEPPEPPPEARAVSIASPDALTLFGGAPSATGVHVSEHAVLGLSVVHRCIEIVAGGIASLPLRAVQESSGVTQVVPSWLDNPAGGLTKNELVELTLTHLLLWGNAYLAHIYGGAGQLVGVQPLHPSAVGINVDNDGAKTYSVSLINGTTKTFSDSMTPSGPYVLTHVMHRSVDGIHGLSPLSLARNSAFGIGLAADRSAAGLFDGGGLVSTIVSVEDDVTEEDAQVMFDGLKRAMAGVSNAGRIAWINRNVKITPWSINQKDLQWLESRQFQKSEIATWFGVPDFMVGLSEKQTSWGTGIDSQFRGVSQWTLKQWTTRIEGRLSLLLPQGVTARFDYHDLLSPDPEAKVGLLLQQHAAGVLTTNEFRQQVNLPPLPGGDALTPSTVAPPSVVNEP